jgi:hypothetical protein
MTTRFGLRWRTTTMNSEERERISETLRLERYRRYNRSAKGARRYKRYEEKHPERATKWPPILEAHKDR